MSLLTKLPFIQIPSSLLTSAPFLNVQTGGTTAHIKLCDLQVGTYFANYNCAFAANANNSITSGSYVYITTGNYYNQVGAVIIGGFCTVTGAGIEECRANISFTFSISVDTPIFIYVNMNTANVGPWSAVVSTVDGLLNTLFFVKLA